MKCGEPEYARRAHATVQAFGEGVRRAPTGFAQLLLAITDVIGQDREIVVRGPDGDAATGEALRTLWNTYAPDALIVRLDPEREDLEAFVAALPLLEGKLDAEVGTNGLLFSCRGYACAAPTTELAPVIEELTAPRAGDED